MLWCSDVFEVGVYGLGVRKRLSQLVLIVVSELLRVNEECALWRRLGFGVLLGVMGN